jgi:single-strand DNA-binding protein
MANLNKVMLIGRLTRDPEVRTFANGGKVAKFGFAVNYRTKNQQTGQWEEQPVFLDCKGFNRETGRKLADLIEQYLSKGRQVYIEGHLRMEEWVGKEDGQKRSKLVVYVDDLQFLDSRGDGQSSGGYPSRSAAAARTENAAAPPLPAEDYAETPAFAESPNDQEIPF